MKYKLKEIGKIVTGCTPKTKNEKYYTSKDYLFIGPIDLKCYKYVRKSEKHVSNIAYNDYSSRFIDSNSIMIDCIGSDMGNVALSTNKVLTNQQINSITEIDKNKFNVDYIYYVLSTMKDYFHQIGTNGSTMPIINKSMFEEIEIEIPDKHIQDKVVSILSGIDKKIELNDQINDNLLKFAINYINSKQEKNQVSISNFANIQSGYSFKSKDLINKPTNNRIIKIKNLRTQINADVVNSQFVEDKVISNLDTKFKLEKGDVTIAMTGTELGKTGLIYGFDKYYLNQRVGVIRGKNEESELYLKILFLSDEFQMLLNSKGYGSAQPNISAINIENILIRDITKNNLKEIYKKLNPIYYKIISNCEENLNLEKLRDKLLPKLMNGDIYLDKIEI